MIPVPTVLQLASFSGRPEDSYTSYAESALLQATLQFTVATEITADDWSSGYLSADDQLLAIQGICAYADHIYLEFPYQQVKASPLLGETIGSYCVDERTEILTQRGWLTHEELLVGDLTLGLDESSWQSSWQPVLSVHRFPAMRREMVLFESGRFSALTTPTHRWLTTLRGVPVWTTSAVLARARAEYKIPFAAPHAAPVEAKYSDALVELVAWLWTEGGWAWKGRHRGVRIHQSHAANPGNCARIRNALREVFGPSSSSLRGAVTWNEAQPAARPGMSVFCLSAEASAVLTEHVTSEDKTVRTEFLRRLTHSQLLLFIEVSMLGDRSGEKQLAQRNKAAAEQFMLACILAGKRVSIHENGYGMWSVTHTSHHLGTSPSSIRRNALYNQSGSLVETVPYGGMVWCPRTPSRNWLARRDGTVYFTGNTYSKPPPVEMRNVQAQELGVTLTGVDLWDMAIQYLSKRTRAAGVFFGQVKAFDVHRKDVLEGTMVRRNRETGELELLGPGDFDRLEIPPFSVSGEVFPSDPGVG